MIVDLQYELTEDAEDRLTKIFEFLLIDKNPLQEARNCLTNVNYHSTINNRKGDIQNE
jgi:hypothetical protein